MMTLKMVAIALGVGALFAVSSSEIGADFILAIASCFS